MRLKNSTVGKVLCALNVVHYSLIPHIIYGPLRLVMNPSLEQYQEQVLSTTEYVPQKTLIKENNIDF